MINIKDTNKNEIYYSSKILNDSLSELIKELDESLKDIMNKEYFDTINNFKFNINSIIESLNNKIVVEKMIFNELKESIDLKILVSEDKVNKRNFIKNVIMKYIDFQYEIMKDCLFILKSFNNIDISFYKKYKSDYMFKIIGIYNSINLSNINILGYIEYIEDINEKKVYENNAWEIMNKFLSVYELYK